jgi:maleate isomerase
MNHRTFDDPAIAQPNYGTRLRLGVLMPCRNTVAEPDFRALLPAGVSLHTTRLRLLGTSSEELLAMTRGIEKEAELLAAAKMDLLAFHCTAASTLSVGLGADVVARMEKSTGVKSTVTSDALIAALAALKAKRIVMVSPYKQHINDSEVAFFAQYGIQVLAELGLGLPDAQTMSAVTPEEWYDRTMALARDDADAYFLSCTNIRAIPAIQRLEDDLGKPVITSNQAMAWHCLRTAGLEDVVPGYGRLLSSH